MKYSITYRNKYGIPAYRSDINETELRKILRRAEKTNMPYSYVNLDTGKTITCNTIPFPFQFRK